jgi:hypothetical protein
MGDRIMHGTWTWRALLLLSLTCSLTTGCGDDASSDDDGNSGTGGDGDGDEFDAGSDPDRNMVTVGELCSRMAHIQCAGEQYCCDAPSRDLDTCREKGESACTNTLQLDVIGMSDLLVVDDAEVEAAFAEFEQRASECDLEVKAWATSRELMTGILGGSLAEGADCTPEDENDVVDLGTAMFACADGADVVCLPGDGAAPWTCEQRSQVAGDCFVDWNCIDGLYCSVGVCTERRADGEACTAANQCASLFCEDMVCAAPTQQLVYCLE